MDSTRYVLSQLIAGEIKCVHWERALGSLLLVFLWLSPNMPFPFAEFALHIFAVINFTHESPVSPCSESMNWRWSWGPLTQEVRGDVGRQGRCGGKG